MTDKEYKEQKKRIKKLINKWRDKLGLGWWRIEFDYFRDTEQRPKKAEYSPKIVDERWEAALMTKADPYYLTAQIDCYLSIIQNIEDDELEEYFLHEIMHIFLSAMHTKEKANEEELIATKLAQAFIWSQNE